MDEDSTQTIMENTSKSKLSFRIILSLGFLLVVLYYIFLYPVLNNDKVVHITPSESLSKIASKLESENVIRSSSSFKILVYIFSGDRYIKPGDYLFKKGKGTLAVAWQLSRGVHGVEPIRITIKEGFTRDDIANLLSDKVPSFRKDLFLSDVRSKEGYLFPDTYFFFPLSTNDEILNEITSNFNRRIMSIDEEIKSSGKSLSDIIIMASIIEKEANGKDDSPVISGILWKRLRLGMPLQVDAAKETYKEKGLPKTPISNPGLISISSAVSPQDSPYLFYLHDKDGNVHYAVDFNQHKSNINKYLK